MRIEDGKVYLEKITSIKLYGDLIVINDISGLPIVLTKKELEEIVLRIKQMQELDDAARF